MNETRIYGPPGTGKTTFLSRQANRAAEVHGGDAVLVASLTRTAAKEVAGRDTVLPRRNIGTLHAHAYRALDRPQLADIPKGLKQWNEWIVNTAPWFRVSGGSSGIDEPLYESLGGEGEGASCLARLNASRATRMPLGDHNWQARKFEGLWSKWKEETGHKDFTDLIEDAIKYHDAPPGIRVIMVDEAQDMSALEMELIRKWGADCADLVVVGDADQALYGFRGGDSAAAFSGDVDREKVLSQSYRVPRAVHALATRWIQRIPDRHPAEYKPTEHEGAVHQSYANWKNPRELISELTATYGATMVLTACGFMLTPLLRELRLAGIPFHNPYRPARGDWNPLRGAGRLTSFLACKTWDDVAKWMEPIQAKALLTRGAKSRVLEQDQDSTIDLRTYRELFVSEDSAFAAINGDVEWWEKHLLSSKRASASYPLAVLRKQGADALTQVPKLIAGTVHSVKGGEADHVWLAPDLSRAGYLEYMQGNPSVIRQMYVGMTRARETLTLLAPAGRHMVVF